MATRKIFAIGFVVERQRLSEEMARCRVACATPESELGHALGLPHRQNTTNLMASGTTGTWLNDEEISQTRETARGFAWVESASSLMEKANALFRANKRPEAATLYSRLATIPLKAEQVELAKKRAGLAKRMDSSSPAK